jgi:hypothetical protein
MRCTVKAMQHSQVIVFSYLPRSIMYTHGSKRLLLVNTNTLMMGKYTKNYKKVTLEMNST